MQDMTGESEAAIEHTDIHSEPLEETEEGVGSCKLKGL